MFRPLTTPFIAALALAAVNTQPIGFAWAQTASGADETALRFYASQGQTSRVTAEARRLSQKFPDWHIPTDLYSTKPGSAGEEPLWALYAEDRIDDLQKAIRAREAAQPEWHPSADLLMKIDQRATRALIMQAARSGAWHDVVQRANVSGIAWAAQDPEVLWTIADAYARESDLPAAYAAFQAILGGQASGDERAMAIQRAIATMPFSYVEKLVASGHQDANGRSEFESIGIDITRARLSAYLHGQTVNAISAADLSAFQTFARTAEDSNQSGLAAWYFFKQGDNQQALEWFKLSMSHGGDAMIAHGLALTLRKLGLDREAEEVAYAWREPLINNAILYIDILGEQLTKDHPPSIEPARLARYAQAVTGTSSGEGAQALAWYAYNTCQFPEALEWFEHAVSWKPKEATVLGYALTLQHLKRAKEFREIVNRYDGLFPKVVALAFDNGNAGTPVACEAKAKSPQRASGNAPLQSAQTDQARALASWAPIPSPDVAAIELRGGANALRPKTDFPFAVHAENPLRFSAIRIVTSEDQSARGPSKAPRVARRVLGVGQMPYEHYGFALRPAWDGTNSWSSPSATERQAPAGTFAALEPSVQKNGTQDHGGPNRNGDLELGRLQR